MVAQTLVLFTFYVLIAGIVELGRQRTEETRQRAARVLAHRQLARTASAPRSFDRAA